MTSAGLPDVPGFRADQLEGFRIGVTSDRRSEDLISAFERRGAEVVHAPTISMAGDADGAKLEQDTRAVIAARPRVLLATTSYGIRTWLEAADAAGLGPELLEVLGGARILVRGPKARGAIRAAGLEDHGMSERETTQSLVDLLLREPVAGQTVALQLHGVTDEAQIGRLAVSGARVLTVKPYHWELHENSSRVARLVEAVSCGSLDAVTFTSAPAAEGLLHVAERIRRLPELIRALQGPVAAVAVGNVTAEPLVRAGIEPVVPERYRMGALIRITCEHLEGTRVLRHDTQQGRIELRGALVVQDAGRALLTPTSAALLRTLLTADGATVDRRVLAESSLEPLDDHAVEMAVSRLRQALPEPRVVATVIKRGYRLAVR